MAWCLSEAIFDRDRKFLKTCASISVHQDVRAPVLLMRFGASSAHGRSLQGAFGIATDFGTTSNDIKAATLQVLKDFATPRRQPPGKPNHSPPLDKVLYDHIRGKIHLFDADGASDEQRAGRILSTVTNGGEPAFPHVNAVVRDRPHASRRLKG